MERGHSCQACIAAALCASEGALKLQNWASPWIARKVYREQTAKAISTLLELGSREKSENVQNHRILYDRAGVFELMQAVEIDTRSQVYLPKVGKLWVRLLEAPGNATFRPLFFSQSSPLLRTLSPAPLFRGHCALYLTTQAVRQV